MPLDFRPNLLQHVTNISATSLVGPKSHLRGSKFKTSPEEDTQISPPPPGAVCLLD